MLTRRQYLREDTMNFGIQRPGPTRTRTPRAGAVPRGWSSTAAQRLRQAAWAAATALTLAATPLAAQPADAATDDGARTALLQVRQLALTRAKAAVVGLRSTAVEDAVSARSLGRERQGSGVVIDDDGLLVLTIGYLVLEAEQVAIEIDGGRQVPGRVLAYDQATGLGLVQALAPLPLPAARFGRATSLGADEPLMIASGGSEGDLSLARLVSKRPFSGYWEYHIDDALFTAPPRADHSGAALFNADGELLGIGSLVVGDARGPGQPPLQGNMFVPIDLLVPILGELRERGSSRSSHRAWMGVNCAERNGEVRVLRVADDSPAEAAGLRAGDQIVAIDGTAVMALETFYKALWRGDSPQREVSLDIRRAGELRTVKVQAQDRERSLRKAQGI
jgi:serine protease Do